MLPEHNNIVFTGFVRIAATKWTRRHSTWGMLIER